MIHDLRRTAATHMAEIGVQPHIIEAVLNHVSGHQSAVAGIYNRAAYSAEKKDALERWAAHIQSIVQSIVDDRKVVAIRGGAVMARQPRSVIDQRLDEHWETDIKPFLPGATQHKRTNPQDRQRSRETQTRRREPADGNRPAAEVRPKLYPHIDRCDQGP